DADDLPEPFRAADGGGGRRRAWLAGHQGRGFSHTGRELWKARLPAGGQATPMTYQSRSGRQMVVVVAGGHGSLGTKAGDSV
ncbi:membrane-bound PQQ-dependent dehydrogenase, glucose/quinate/shikimate family, partial [Escherichia coli]